MYKLILFLCVIFLFNGCAYAQINKSLKISIECEKCVTPYGKGDRLKIDIKRDVFIEKGKNAEK